MSETDIENGSRRSRDPYRDDPDQIDEMEMGAVSTDHEDIEVLYDADNLSEPSGYALSGGTDILPYSQRRTSMDPSHNYRQNKGKERETVRPRSFALEHESRSRRGSSSRGNALSNGTSSKNSIDTSRSMNDQHLSSPPIPIPPSQIVYPSLSPQSSTPAHLHSYLPSISLPGSPLKPYEATLKLEDELKRLAATLALSEDDFVTLSVQGTPFVLQRDFVLSHDWMPSKVLTSALPFTSVNGQIYLDVDPICFRVIVSVLKGLSDLDSVASKLTSPELALLISMSRYLLICTEITEPLEKLESSSRTEKTALLEELRAKTERIAALERQLEVANWESQIMDVLESKDLTLLTCHGYITGVPYNRCGRASLLVGPLELNGTDLCCKACNSEVRGAKSKLHKSTKIARLHHAVNHLRNN
ncbi:hypothetical protein HDV05_000830 [Chytridiales sp. JEL 0842]|nr:hypothetical protein HDV05_000830 [Chytridiales sp. JEL 0842]